MFQNHTLLAYLDNLMLYVNGNCFTFNDFITQIVPYFAIVVPMSSNHSPPPPYINLNTNYHASLYLIPVWVQNLMCFTPTVTSLVCSNGFHFITNILSLWPLKLKKIYLDDIEHVLPSQFLTYQWWYRNLEMWQSSNIIYNIKYYLCMNHRKPYTGTPPAQWGRRVKLFVLEYCFWCLKMEVGASRYGSNEKIRKKWKIWKIPFWRHWRRFIYIKSTKSRLGPPRYPLCHIKP